MIRASAAFRFGWLAATLAVVGFRWWTTSRWSYFQDDWVLSVRAGEDSLGHFMATSYNGHTMAGGNFFLWLFTDLDPLNYTWLALMTCVLTALVMLGWGLALRELFGERPHLLAVLVLIGFSPPTTTVALWWSGNVFFYPLVAATGFALWFLARYLLRGERRSDQLGVLLSVALGLFFWNKSVLIAIPLGFLPMLVVAGPVAQRIRTGVRALWPTATLIAAYLVLWVAVPRPEFATFELEFPRGRTPGQIVDFLFTGVSNIALPAMLGGPFGDMSSAYGAYDYTPVWIRVLCVVAAVVAVALAVTLRRRAGWALLMTATYVFASWGLALFSSRYDQVGIRVIFEGRYLCDILPVLLLAAVFMTTRLRDPDDDPLTRPLSPGLLSGARATRTAYLVLAACLATGLSIHNWDLTKDSSPEPWVSALVSDAKDLGSGDVYDSVTPEYTLSPTFYYGQANLSDILAPLDQGLRFNEPTQNGLLVVGEDGHLSEGEVLEPATKTVTPGPDADCGYSLQPAQTRDLPLDGAAYEFEWIVQIDYFTPAAADVTVTTDKKTVDLTLEATPAGGFSRLQYVVVDSVGRLQMTVADGAQPVCVTVVKIGALRSTDRRPAPLKPLG